jgi:hypothetical protein
MEENPWQLRHHFISYRWETSEEADWVRAFAAGLRARGYPVILDLELMDAPGAPELRVEQLRQLLALLARATHFTPIATSWRRSG